MQTVIEGNLINYEVFGAKNTQSVIVLHGWKRSLNDWREVAKELSKNKKIILVDLPGFGNSSVPKTPFDTYDYANLVLKIIEKLELKKVTLMGHSVGGKIAIAAGSQNKDLEKLIVVDPSGINKRSFSVKVKSVTNKFLKPGMFLFPEKVRKLILDLMTSEDYRSSGKMKDIFKKIVVQNVSEDAKKIKIPTLIVWGDKDKEVPVSTAKDLKKLISHSTVRIVWNTEHDPFMEKPDKFLEIIQEFL